MKKLIVKTNGSMCFRPDWIEIIITISSANASYNEAMKYLYKKADKMTECLKELNVDTKNIEMIGLTTDLINDINLNINNNIYEGKGIKITQKYKIGVPFSILYIAEIIDKIMHSDIYAEILLIQTTKDKQKIRQKLINNTIKLAKKKAKHLAKTAGVTLGNIITIQYNEKYIEDECYVSQEVFNDCFLPIINGDLLKYEFLPNEISITDEVKIEWKIKK